LLLRCRPLCDWDLKGFKVQTTTSGIGVRADRSYLRLSNFNFGTCAGQHIIGFNGAQIDILTNYTISGSATGASHYLTRYGSFLNNVGFTVTVTGTPAFATFAQSDYASVIECSLSTFSGAATGARYSVGGNAVIQTGGGGASFFPGNAAGTTSSGGQYL